MLHELEPKTIDCASFLVRACSLHVARARRKDMNPVIHFEMPYDQADRMVKFYQSAFGWEMNHLGAEMGDYVMAMTAESNEIGPIHPGAINGGFFSRTPDLPDQCPSVVISVDDIREAMAKVSTAGGKILGEPMEIPGVGQYVSFHDTEGNRVSLLQPIAR
jgi:predicted enzyme related to lactoylglutathione lyase